MVIVHCCIPKIDSHTFHVYIFVEYVFYNCPEISDPDLALLNASKEGDEVNAEMLVHCNETDINTLDRNEGRTPLYLAARYGHLGIVRLLVDHPEISLNVTVPGINEWKGNCALQIASYYGNLDVIELLLQFEEIDVNEWDDKGGTALCWATSKGNSEVVSLLIRTPG